jgi:probable phosphoglycerate mutase
MPSEPVSDGAASNGAASNGAASGGAAGDGVASNGAASGGAASDGVAGDGVAGDGVAGDGSTEGRRPLRRGVPTGVRTVPPADPDATRVVLIRHGEARCNVEGVVGGPLGCHGLTEVGRHQVDALRRRLEATAELARASVLVASTLPRAIETAQLLAPAVGSGDVPVTTDCGLCELHPGRSDGLTWDEVVQRYGAPDWDTDPTTPLAPEGESWVGFVDRAAAAVAALADGHPGATVVAACHAGVIEATVLRWLAPGRARLGLRTRHASLTEWERVGNTWRLVRYNDAAHLASLDQEVRTAG